MWQAKADSVSSLSALPAAAVGQILLEYGIRLTQKIKVDVTVVFDLVVPYSNRIWPGLTEFGPLLWQAKLTRS